MARRDVCMVCGQPYTDDRPSYAFHGLHAHDDEKCAHRGLLLDGAPVTLSDITPEVLEACGREIADLKPGQRLQYGSVEVRRPG